jgi:hypothetical protein
MLDVIQSNGQMIQMSQISYVEQEINSDLNSYWRYIGWLLFTAATLRMLVGICMDKVNHMKR